MVSSTLNGIIGRGNLIVGLGPTIGDAPEWLGDPNGFDRQFGYCLSSAIFGVRTNVVFELTPGGWGDRWVFLENGVPDVLFAYATPTVARETDYNITFGKVIYYNTLVDAYYKNYTAPWGSLTETVDGVVTSLTGQPAIHFATVEDAAAAFNSGQINGFCQDRSTNASFMALVSGGTFLPAVSLDHIGPAVRNGDDDWEEIVSLVIYAVVKAYAEGIGSGNVSNSMPLIQSLNSAGNALGLPSDWAYKVILQNGNYRDLHYTAFGMNPDGNNRDVRVGGLIITPKI